MIGPALPEKVQKLIESSSLHGRYEDVLDRESAYEILIRRAQRLKEEEAQKEALELELEERKAAFDEEERRSRTTRKTTRSQATVRRRSSDTPMEKMAKSMMTSVGRSLGTQLARGLLGSILKGK